MKKITRLFGLGFLSVTALGSFTSCERTGFKVGLLCLHGQTSTYDNNFIEAFEKACKECKLTKDQYDIRTDVSEDYNSCYTAAKEWAEDGYALVCADSFGHQEGLFDVAREYKDTVFCHATGTYVTVDEYDQYGVTNFHNAFASIYEGRYLAGLVAGQRMIEDIKADKYKPEEALIGYVGAFPYAEVKSGFTSFFLGAKAAFRADDAEEGRTGDNAWEPKLKMTVRYTNSWYNFKSEKATAETLIFTDKCKLISQHADSMGAPLACETNGIPNVCYNISTKKKCPNTYLVASKINWEPYFVEAIQHAKDKYDGKPTTFNPDYCGTLQGGSVEIFDYGDSVSQKTKDMVSTVKKKLENHELFVFDTSTFTVSPENNKYGEFTTENGYRTKGHLTSYIADVKDATKQESKYIPDTEVIKKHKNTTYVAESYVPTIGGEVLRSAPYFELVIDDITSKGE